MEVEDEDVKPLKEEEKHAERQEIVVPYFYYPTIYRFEPSSPDCKKVLAGYLTHSLLESFGVLKTNLLTFKPSLVSYSDFVQYHEPNYALSFKNAGKPPSLKSTVKKLLDQKNSSETVQKKSKPRYDAFDFARVYTSGSLGAAAALLQENYCFPFSVNIFGGYSLARTAETVDGQSFNDVVLSILCLLKKFSKVLYINLDFKHQLAVEEAFYSTDRVFSLQYFSELGFDEGQMLSKIDDVGTSFGSNFSLNVPLVAASDDADVIDLISSTLPVVLSYFKPDCIVLQTGAGLFSSDVRGNTNLSLKPFLYLVDLIKEEKMPTMLFPGSSHRTAVSDMARLLFSEIALLLGQRNLLERDIPKNCKFVEYFRPSLNLEVVSLNKVDKETLNENFNGSSTVVKKKLLENMEMLKD
eukprot:augustus_masked-scaffold_50-processed-gene-1.21-mRNA-1 protein AED:0.38 eAED:0.38 QI:0/-1/0/1/-1/1/1/0/410